MQSEQHETLDPRLFLIRRALQEAQRNSSDHLPYSRMSVVLVLDHALEMTIITSLSRLGVTVRREWNMPGLLNAVEDKLPDQAAYRNSIARFRRLRDRVQHDGVIPSKEESDNMLLISINYIRDMIRSAFTIELEQITLSNSLSDADTKARIQQAEECLECQDYNSAVSHSAIAFRIGTSNMQMSSPYTRSYSREVAHEFTRSLEREVRQSIRRVSSSSRSEANSAVGQFATELSRNLGNSFQIRSVIEKLANPFELAAYGIDINEYIRFNSLLPHIIWTLGSESPEVIIPDNWQRNQQEAMFSIEFAVSALIQLERAAQEQHSDSRSTK